MAAARLLASRLTVTAAAGKAQPRKAEVIKTAVVETVKSHRHAKVATRALQKEAAGTAGRLR